MHFASCSLVATAIATLCLGLPAGAVEFPDGRTAFGGASPRLDSAIATSSATSARQIRYYFTLTLPADSDESLQRVAIEQRRNELLIAFELEETRAFVGQPQAREGELAIAATSFEAASRSVTVDFVKPIPPGTTFSISLRPRHNPHWGGIYLFGVTVFPAGDRPQGLFLGSGRLHFYEREQDFLFP